MRAFAAAGSICSHYVNYIISAYNMTDGRSVLCIKHDDDWLLHRRPTI